MMDTITETIERVLIIDDNEIDTLIGAKVLEKNGLANQIITMNDSVEALNYLTNLAHTQPEAFPTLILLDLNMPVMDGWSFLKEYQKIIVEPMVKTILLITSCTTDYKDFDQIKIHPHVHGFMDKPISVEKIKQVQIEHFTN